MVKLVIGFDTLFWANFVDFQNEPVGLCVNNFINKDVKWTFMISQYNLKS